MAYTNGLIHGNVDIRDIQRALRTSKGDIGTLITTGTINKWAKYKPLVVAASTNMGVLTEAQRQAAGHGISGVPYFQRIAAMAAWMRNNGDTSNQPTNAQSQFGKSTVVSEDCFKYTRPTGGNAAPFRMTDFIKGESASDIGYIKDIDPPIGQCDYCALMGDRLVITFPMGIDDDHAVRLFDLGWSVVPQYNADNWRLGICLTRAAATYCATQVHNSSEVGFYRRLSDVYQSGASINDQIFPTNAPTGDYTAFAFLSSVELKSLNASNQVQWQTPPSTTGYFVPLTWTAKTVQIRQPQLKMSAAIQAWTQGTNVDTIYYAIYITSDEDATYNTSSTSLRIYYSDNNDTWDSSSPTIGAIPSGNTTYSGHRRNASSKVNVTLRGMQALLTFTVEKSGVTHTITAGCTVTNSPSRYN